MKWITWCFCALFCLSLYSAEFTVSSYNCGGLPDHYDYIRGACMGKIFEERYSQQATLMKRFEKVQDIALTILFAKTTEERRAAKEKWETLKCSQFLAKIASENAAINKQWQEMIEQTVTPYNVRPIVIHDEDIKQQLLDHVRDITGQIKGPLTLDSLLYAARKKMAKKIFSHQVTHDIICLQEINYLDVDLFPEHYEVQFSNTNNGNGIAWNTNRFEFLETFDCPGRTVALLLRDRDTQGRLFVISAHLPGCNPFFRVGADADKGDQELQAILDIAKDVEAKVKVIAMDSNVTATHPRLKILKSANYTLDYKNYLYPTCPHVGVLLNTRIDWIAVGQDSHEPPSIANIPISGVGLNDFRTNISDHAPIAATISY